MKAVDKKEMAIGRPQYHVRCKPGDVGKYVLLPGDPSRVLLIARYLKDAKEVANNREFLTYTGEYEGVEVSATSTGIGCPSASIALEELANVGAEVFIRVGTTGAIQPRLEVGDLVIATAAVRNEGTTPFYIPAGFPAVPSFEVTRALVESAERLREQLGFRYHLGIVACDDAFYGEKPKFIEGLMELGVASLEMESAAIFAVSHLRGLKAGTILAVAGNLVTGDVFNVKDERVHTGVEKEIQVALEAIRRLEITRT